MDLGEAPIGLGARKYRTTESSRLLLMFQPAWTGARVGSGSVCVCVRVFCVCVLVEPDFSLSSHQAWSLASVLCEEEDAQTDFEKFMGDAKNKHAEDNKSMSGAEGSLAVTNVQMVTDMGTLGNTNTGLIVAPASCHVLPDPSLLDASTQSADPLFWSESHLHGGASMGLGISAPPHQAWPCICLMEAASSVWTKF